MFGTIRKHQTWLWAIIITLTVISFVIYFSPYSRVNGGRATGSYGSINGRRITEQEYIDALHEADLFYFLKSGGHWLRDERRAGNDEMAETYKWLVLTRAQDQLGIRVGDDAAEKMARQIVYSFERMGINSPQMFIERILQPHGLGLGDFERFVRHYVGIEQLIATTGLSGKLITPEQAKGLYEREHQELATEAVFFQATNYLATVQVNPETISQYYSNRLATYAIPERVQVAYALFNVTNFLPQAETDLSTNLNALIEENYQRLGTNYFPDAKTPEEAKKKIREQLVRQDALALAAKKANQFVQNLSALQSDKPQILVELARTNGIESGVTAPFDRDQTPKGLDVTADFTKKAFALSPTEPFSMPILGHDGVYVLAFDKLLPRETPTLDQIRDKVTSDYRQAQARMLAYQAAISVHRSLTNGLAQGKPFTNLCAEAHLNAIKVPPFSLSTRQVPEVEQFVSMNTLQRAAFGTQPGKASSVEPTQDGAMILYVQAKLPLDATKADAELPTYLSSLRRNRQEQAFNMWFSREFNKQLREGLRNTQLAQELMRQPPPSMAGSQGKS